MCDVIDIVRQVYIKSASNIVEQKLRFRIWTHNQNLLKIDMSDDANPLFQCFIEITEAKFKEIREGQDINTTSLENLKYELVKLFEKCNGGERDAKFFLLLDEAEQPQGFHGYDIVKKRLLKIVEKSVLKNLIHFTFEVTELSDAEIKTALLTQIKELKVLCNSHNDKIVGLECEVKELTNDSIQKSEELVALQNELKYEKIEFDRKCKEIKASAKEKELKVSRECEVKLQMEKEELTKQFKHEMDQLQKQIKDFKCENKALKSNLEEEQLSLRNEIQKCEILEVKLNGAKDEVEFLKANNTKLDVDYHGKEKSVNTLRTRLAVCEQELKDKISFITSMQKQINTASDEKECLQKYAEELEKILKQKEETISTLGNDILKANEIILISSAKTSTIEENMKVVTSVVQEQEKTIKKKEEEVSNLRKCLQSEKDALSKLENDKDTLSKLVESLKQTVSLSKQRADIDSKVITWFSRTLRQHSVQNTERYPKAQCPSIPDSEIGTAVSRNEVNRMDLKTTSPILPTFSSESSPAGNRIGASNVGAIQNMYPAKTSDHPKDPSLTTPPSEMPASTSSPYSHVPDYVLRRMLDFREEEEPSSEVECTNRPNEFIWKKYLSNWNNPAIFVNSDTGSSEPRNLRYENLRRNEHLFTSEDILPIHHENKDPTKVSKSAKPPNEPVHGPSFKSTKSTQPVTAVMLTGTRSSKRESNTTDKKGQKDKLRAQDSSYFH